jgi:hypothetical protein
MTGYWSKRNFRFKDFKFQKMKTTENIWVVEAHDLGALQVRAVGDAIKLNRKRWLAGEKADRSLVGIGGTIDEALGEERELKRKRSEVRGQTDQAERTDQGET